MPRRDSIIAPTINSICAARQTAAMSSDSEKPDFISLMLMTLAAPIRAIRMASAAEWTASSAAIGTAGAVGNVFQAIEVVAVGGLLEQDRRDILLRE